MSAVGDARKRTQQTPTGTLTEGCICADVAAVIGNRLNDEQIKALCDALNPGVAVAAALAPIEALVSAWEREADAIAITYQDPDARHDATVGHRAAIAAVRAALAGGGDHGCSASCVGICQGCEAEPFESAGGGDQ